MPERDSQNIVLNRQSILMVTAVGVGLLTMCYVLGVQVGKQSAALHQPLPKGSGEDLLELPVPLADQLKTMEGMELEKVQRVFPGEEAPKASPPTKTEASKPQAPAKGERWTAQLVSTTDASEADRMAAKAKTAGFAATIHKEKGTVKVRLTKSSSRADVDAVIQKLKTKGLNAFAVKVE